MNENEFDLHAAIEEAAARDPIIVRKFALACARHVQHLMADPRSVRALNVAERFLRGEASRTEIEEALKVANTAQAAALAARGPRVSSEDDHATHAAHAATCAVYASYTARVAYAAAYAAAYSALVGTTEREWQEAEFRRVGG